VCALSGSRKGRAAVAGVFGSRCGQSRLENLSMLSLVSLPGSTLQSLICSNDALFYFVFFYPFPIFGILIITILLVRFKSRNSSKNSDGKNGVPLLWIKEPHLNYSPTCLEPPVLSIHPGAID
jgi:hypothetical protein